MAARWISGSSPSGPLSRRRSKVGRTAAKADAEVLQWILASGARELRPANLKAWSVQAERQGLAAASRQQNTFR
jgi:hypothetical protein